MTSCQNDFLYSQVFKPNATSTNCFPRVYRTVWISDNTLKKNQKKKNQQHTSIARTEISFTFTVPSVFLFVELGPSSHPTF